MKTIDTPPKAADAVISEVHRHKEAIAAEHGFDVDALLGSLQSRQKGHPRLVSKVVDRKPQHDADHTANPQK
jgi:hypothetical protein